VEGASALGGAAGGRVRPGRPGLLPVRPLRNDGWSRHPGDPGRRASPAEPAARLRALQFEYRGQCREPAAAEDTAAP